MRFLPHLIASAFLLASGAQAQLRTIPDEAQWGELRQGVIVTTEGKEQPLAAGAQVRDGSNRIVVPSAVTAGTRVKYQLDRQGLAHRVWILTPEEAAKAPAAAKPGDKK